MYPDGAHRAGPGEFQGLNMDQESPFHYSQADFFQRNFPFAIRRFRHVPADFPTERCHVRDFFKIVYCFQGEGEYRVEDRSYPIARGTAILVHPGFRTTFRIAGAALDICNILFQPEFIRDHLLRLDDPGVFFAFFRDRCPPVRGSWVFPGESHLEELILRMLGEYETRDGNYRVVLELLLTDLMIQLGRNVAAGAAKFKAIDTMADLKRRLETGCADPFSLRTLCAEYGIAPSRLCRLYRRETGSSIRADLNRNRVKLARKLLLEPGMSVTEVCFKSGFGDLSCFYRNFRKATGMTPLAFRKNGRN